jgi:hypothetical protein
MRTIKVFVEYGSPEDGLWDRTVKGTDYNYNMETNTLTIRRWNKERSEFEVAAVFHHVVAFIVK